MYIKLFGGGHLVDEDLLSLMKYEHSTIYIDVSWRYFVMTGDYLSNGGIDTNKWDGTYYCRSCDCHFSVTCPIADNLNYAAAIFREISALGGKTRRMSACEYAMHRAAEAHMGLYWLDASRCVKVL
jgi:hypothetical protein